MLYLQAKWAGETSKIIYRREKMKNKKWLTYTVGTLLTLIVLVAVAGAGFRAGMMQNGTFMRGLNSAGHPAFSQNFDGNAQQPQAQGNQQQGNMQADPHQWNNDFQGMQGNPHQGNGDFQRMQGNNSRGNDRRGGFSPIFGLFHLIVVGALLWFGYKFVQKSGWRLTRVAQAATAEPVAPSAPETVETVSDDEKKDEA